MKFDLNTINNDFVRKALAQAVVLKAEGLLKWQAKKLADIQAEIAIIVGDGENPSEVVSTKLDRLVEQYARFDEDHSELQEYYGTISKQYEKAFGERVVAPVNTGNALARAKAILAKA